MMGTSSVQTDSLLQSRKKRSFRLPIFRRSSAHVERQEVAMRREEESGAEEAARVQKAAAWQWYTRGVGEAVLPTKRPPPLNAKSPPCQAPVGDGTSKAVTNNSTIVLQKKPPEQPLHAESPRAASRFKAEATIRAGAPPTPSISAPSAGPSTPLYDEFELSGLRTQMAGFVQRLQSHQQTKDNEAQKSKPLEHIALHDGRPLPAAASVSTDHQHTSKAAAAISSVHHHQQQQLTKPPPSAAPLASTIPFHMRPFSALHRLFRKVVSGSILKSTKNSPIINSYEAEVLSEEEEENTPYHYHHYIHHHHHHYHYDQTPEAIIHASGRRRHSDSSGIRPNAESDEEEEEIERSSIEAYHLGRRRHSEAAIIRSGRRRHSESSGIRPHIPSQLEAESDEEEEEIERSSIEAYIARRRRHSDSFAGHLTPQKEEMKGDTAKEALPLQLPRRYNSERFSPNKIPTMVSKYMNEGFPETRSRSRQSAENQREEESSERKAGGGGKIGGGTYKLSRGAMDGKALVRRRHSEGPSPSPGRPYWHSPSARYLEGVLERQIGVAALSNARRPPIYPH